MIDPLHKDAKAVLRMASERAVRERMPDLRPLLRRRRWLDKGNRYAGAGIRLIDDDVAPGGPGVSHDDFSGYLAASALPHVMDGWSYLGSGLYALSRGDADHALHFGYYASLRAALAIHAAQGVAVLSRKHFVLDGQSKAVRVPKEGRGTHVVAWLALEYWMARRASGKTVASAITPGGISLTDWVASAFTANAANLVARQWLNSWGVDLKRFAKDQYLRNAASYRPMGRGKRPPSAARTAHFLTAIWELLEPSGLSPFDQLDRQLLRRALEATFEQVTGRPATDPAFATAISTVVANVGAPPSSPGWLDFLTRRTSPSDSAVLEAATAPLRSQTPEHFAVLARALLLLRISSGIVGSLRTRAGLSSAELRFWWQPILEDRGVWPSAAPPPSPIDLWVDVQIASGNVRTWSSSNPNAGYRRLNNDCSTDLHELAGVERAGAWGLGL